MESFVCGLLFCTLALLAHPLPDFFREGTPLSLPKAAFGGFFALVCDPVLGFGPFIIFWHFGPPILSGALTCLLFWDCVKKPCVLAGWVIGSLSAPLISVPPALMSADSRLSPSTSAGGGRQLIHMAIAPAVSRELGAASFG